MLSKLKERMARAFSNAVMAVVFADVETSPEKFKILRRPSKPSDSKPEAMTAITYEIKHPVFKGELNPDPGEEIERPEDLSLEARSAEITDPALRAMVLALFQREWDRLDEREDQPPEVSMKGLDEKKGPTIYRQRL